MFEGCVVFLKRNTWRWGGHQVDETSPHISPGFVARAVRRRAQWGFQPRGPAGIPSTVRRWGSCAEVKARGGSRCPSIVDDEQRRDRPRPPSARRVAAPWARLLRCRSSAMKDIAVVAAPRIRTHGARNGRCWGPRPDLAGRGARTRPYVEHREARKHHWVRCIADRSRKLVRYAG